MNCLQAICWIFYELTRILQSNGHICLTWTLTGDSLKLKCFTSQIYAKISFYNPFNHEQGYCYIPQPSPACISYHKNSSINQMLKGKETVLEVRGNIDSNINGKWSCNHGTNVEMAITNVKLPHNIAHNTPVYVRLTGPTFIKTNDPVWLTCITNVPMETKLVRFYVNGQLYITLNNDEYNCYTSKNNDTCTLNECQCSEDGRTYVIKHKGFTSGGIFSIECKAEFELSLEMSDCVMINVIDIDGPKIMKDKALPFLVSDLVELTCIAFINNTDVHLDWDCLDFQPDSNFKNTTFIKSVVSFKVSSSMKDKICTCNAIFMNIKTTTSLTIDTNNAPVLALTRSVVCTQLNEIQLFCNASGDLPIVQFGTWVHTYNGYVIRHLAGHRFEKTSTLLLAKCSYEDEGNYMCNACSNDESSNLCNNISSKVVIKGLPCVTGKYIYKIPMLTFSANIYAMPQPWDIYWLIGNERIENSTRYVQSLTKTMIKRTLHGQTIKTYGFSMNLTVKTNENIRETIALFVQNDIGNITEYFVVDDDKVSSSETDLDLKDIFWFLSGAVVLILISAVFAYLFKHHIRKDNGETIDMRTIYDVVEPTESNIHQYDVSEPMSSYVEINNFPPNEQDNNEHNEYEEIDKEDHYAHDESEDSYELAHEYTDVF